MEVAISVLRSIRPAEAVVREGTDAAEPAHPGKGAASAVLEAFVLSRVLILAVTAAMALILRESPLTLWDRWDSKWYLGIAAHGYHWTVDGKPAIAFFPLYPLLVHLGSAVGLPEEWAGMAISNAAFIGALFYLYHLTYLRWGSGIARRAVWVLALFPTAFITFLPYTEALFLLASAGALYHAERRQPLPAGAWVTVAVLSRSTGLALLVAVFIALGPHRLRSWLFTLVPSGFGLAAFAVYLHSQNIALATILRSQRSWHRALTLPWTGFSTSITWLLQHAPRHVPWAAENLVQLGVTVAFLGLTVLAWPHLGRPAAVYCAGFWILVLTSPEWMDGYYAPFSSMDRFVLALFPLAGWAAARLPGRDTALSAATLAACMATVAAIHLYGGWVG